MKIRVLDFETSGTPEDRVRAICEVGYTDVVVQQDRETMLGDTLSCLINPGHPIPPITRAVHHISDGDVLGAPRPDYAAELLMRNMDEGDMFAAHNAQFEKAFFAGGNVPWICTYKCAQHLYPEAPKHSNQVLRYWLKLDELNHFEEDRAMPPHRAGPDTYVTALLVVAMLEKVSSEKLVELTTTPVLLQTVSFGKHRGRKWSDLPRDYLDWVAFKSDLDSEAKYTARYWLREKR